MAGKNKIIMAWSKCKIEIAPANEAETMPTEGLTSIGTIKDKSSSLEPSDGGSLDATATGGVRVAHETQEGGYVLKTRVIEPTDDLKKMLGLGDVDESGEFKVITHVVEQPFAVKLTPKNKGAKGIKAPLTSVSYKPGWTEEEGRYADLSFELLNGAADYWYSEFTTTEALK